MVVSLADSDGDGSPDPYAPIFRFEDISFSEEAGVEYSLNYSFEYE